MKRQPYSSKNYIRSFFFTVLLMSSFYSFSQPKYTISGYIKDKKNGENLTGVTIYVKESGSATASNVYGFYSISLPQGKYTLNYQYIGYKTLSKEVDLNANLKLDMEVEEERVQLSEIEVTSERPDANVKSAEMSVNKLDIRQISRIPALLGEVDVIRSIQLLPGVSSVGEGASGFNVRGGSIDQNLVLIDEAPVYNSSHLFGFFSVFNPDAVKDVKLYKGGIPAQYGGRLSSLLDVRLKEGNSKRLAAQGGIGSIFSRLTIEGPIKKDKGSFIIAGRRSYIDALLQPAVASNADLKGFVLYFYDLTLKANYTIGKKDRVFVSGYLGRDKFGQGSFNFNWGNSTFTTRWNHLFSDKLFMNLTAFYSNYDYGLGAQTSGNGDAFNWTSNIQNYSIKPEFTWYVSDKNTISIGGQSILYDFFPGNLSIKSGRFTTERTLSSKYGLENAIYISHEHKLSPRLTATYGLRFSNFNYINNQVQLYDASAHLNSIKKPYETDTSSTTKIQTSYWQPEPRIGIKFELNDKSAIKSSYMRTVQYIHLISNTAASIPLDVWTPSTNNIKPQLCDQYTLGYFRNFGLNNDYEASVEGFYKNMQNQLDYVDNANLLLNPYLEGEILAGRGKAYGLEFHVKKNSGQFTGWISYTLGRTERQVDGISDNQWYAGRFDRTHNLSIVMNYQVKNKFLFFNDRWNFSGSIAYGSGTPVNLPTNGFSNGLNYVPTSPNNIRNNVRVPNYFRTDISVTLKNKKRAIPEEMPGNFFKALKYRYEWELVFSLYNFFSSANAFSLVAREDPSISSDDKVFKGNEVPVGYAPDGKHILVQKFSVIAFIIPGVTYNFKF